mmetsp:Transcript_60522/g.196102  ORF Transcript_60522/g.196102 Transcript_60522/m.196102 type:complete len:91 (+) Transcript_60522:196-468(+)
MTVLFPVASCRLSPSLFESFGSTGSVMQPWRCTRSASRGLPALIDRVSAVVCQYALTPFVSLDRVAAAFRQPVLIYRRVFLLQSAQPPKS